MTSDRTSVGEASHEQVREHAETLSAQAKEVAAEYCRQECKIVGEWKRGLEDQIREKPIQSLLMAGGIGVLGGLLYGSLGWRRARHGEGVCQMWGPPRIIGPWAGRAGRHLS